MDPSEESLDHRLIRLERSSREMEDLIKQLTDEMQLLCPNSSSLSQEPPPGAPFAQSHSQLKSKRHARRDDRNDPKIESKDDRNPQEIRDDMVKRDEFLRQYAKYAHANLDVLLDSSLSLDGMAQQLDSIAHPPLPCSLPPASDSIEIQSRITSLVSLVGKQKKLPISALALSQPAPASPRPVTSPFLSQPTRKTESCQPIRPKQDPMNYPPYTARVPVPSSQGGSRRLNMPRQALPPAAGMDLTQKLPTVVRKKRLTSSATPSPVGGNGIASPDSMGVEIPALPGEDVDLGFLEDDNAPFIMTEAQNAELEDLLKDVLDFPSVVNEIFGSSSTT